MDVGAFYLPSVGTKEEILKGMAGKRTDLYQQMLMNHNQPPFTVIESHRSIGSSHMNQDLHSTSKKKDFYTVNTSEFENQK